VRQLEENVAALDSMELSEDELSSIDAHAVDSGVDMWRSQSSEEPVE
jgi:L-glyceraldehyde 3-phosphate reductase